jgi:hypothetical protein
MKQFTFDQEALAQVVERWTQLTKDEEEMPPRMPLKIFTAEAMDVASTIDRHFEDEVVHDGIVRVGLRSAATEGGVSREVATEIRELSMAVGEVNNDYKKLLEKMSNAIVQEGEELLSELRAVLSFLLESGDNPTGAEQLQRLRDEYDDVQSHDGMAIALQGYAGLAADYKEQIDRIGGLTPGLIDRATQLSFDLRQRSGERMNGNFAQEQKDMMRLRNRMVSALYKRMNTARRTIRFVFREHPDIVRKASSDYLRSHKRVSRARTSDVSTLTGSEDTQEAPTPEKEVG